MSVANEAVEGDYIYNIYEWYLTYVNKDNEQIELEKKMEIGEELVFIDAYLEEDSKFKPYAWQVKFKCKDGTIGNAADFNFVTKEDWDALKEYFKNNQ